ncbi:MAG: metallophosphoesterase [Clostridia bacterium]|nr:metallophosphoesterase [Clostridia bacterium]
MSFLTYAPSVFVIGEEYELLLCLRSHGLLSVRVGDTLYYEENSGALPTERTVARVRVPQAALNAARGYEVIFRAAIDRRAYYSLFEEEERESYPFSPLPAKGDIHVYLVADVHSLFESAARTVTYFGEELHLLIAAGDIAEVEREEDFLAVIDFLGKATGGRLPILMVRGNHDTRGHLAERFTDYFPADGRKTYYSFDLGRFVGVVLDCGEDKPDAFQGTDKEGKLLPPSYNGVNIFEAYRRRETEFLRSLSFPEDGRPRIAVCHIPPAITTCHKGDIFDIEHEVYAAWNAELERLGIDVMLSGHLHKIFLAMPDDERNTLPHAYPILVGAWPKNYKSVIGTAITLTDTGLTYRFTDEEHAVLEEGHLDFVR